MNSGQPIDIFSFEMHSTIEVRGQIHYYAPLRSLRSLRAGNKLICELQQVNVDNSRARSIKNESLSFFRRRKKDQEKEIAKNCVTRKFIFNRFLRFLRPPPQHFPSAAAASSRHRHSPPQKIKTFFSVGSSNKSSKLGNKVL